MRSTYIATAALALVCGCTANAPSSPQDLEQALRAKAQTVVQDPTFALYSPYDEPTTAAYASVVDREAALVRDLLEREAEPPVRLYLVVTAGDDASDHEPWREVSRGGFGGGAFHEGFAFIYVRQLANPSAALIQASLGARSIRHELAHLYARRAGLVRGRWFHEGMAREIETMREGRRGLREHVLPPRLIAARASARAGSVERLLGWSRDDDLELSEHRRLYDEAQALFRFLCQRQPSGSWVQRCREVLALSDAQIADLESMWLAWLGDLDALAAIREGMRSTDTAERQESASLLPILAEAGCREVLTPAADQLALQLLDDADASSSSASFLLFFRASDLTGEAVAELCRSPSAARCLTGLALRARRGEAIDAQLARAAWSRVPGDERPRLETQRSVLRVGDGD